MARILAVEDDARLRTFLKRVLESDGNVVAGAESGPEGVRRTQDDEYDLILLDLMLPGIDGFEVLRRVLDRDPEQRVLVLSAVGDVASRVRCLQMGAVDFLCKPFAAAELIARVRARLRAPGSGGPQRWIRVGDVSLDLERQALDVDGNAVPLSHLEFVLLGHLMRRAGEVCSRARAALERLGLQQRPRQQRGRRHGPPGPPQGAPTTHRDGAQCRVLLLGGLTRKPCSSAAGWPSRQPACSSCCGSRTSR